MKIVYLLTLLIFDNPDTYVPRQVDAGYYESMSACGHRGKVIKLTDPRVEMYLCRRVETKEPDIGT